MATKPDYEVGTVTVALDGTTVTGVGTLWVAADIQPGDMFGASGYPMTRIVEVLSNTSLTIEPWRGAALPGGSAYFVRYQPDGSRFTAALRTLYASLSGGSVAALQALTGAADKLPYFTGPGAMALADFKVWGRSFLGLSMAADRIAYGTDANTMALTPLTAAGRAMANATGTPTGNQGIVTTGAATSVLFDFTAAGRTLVGQANQADMRTYMGVQPLSTNLTLLQSATGPVVLAYRSGNVLGTVSQSGGTPTGAVIERGSNANGEYVRYADGTQVCWGTVASAAATTASGPLFTSGSNGWTFPVAFISAPNVTASASISASFANAVGPTTTAVSLIRFCTVTDAVTTRTISAIAVGRWF